MVGRNSGRVKQPLLYSYSVKKGLWDAKGGASPYESLLFVAVRIVPLKQVFSEVAIEIAPHRVDVVSIVLCIIKLDQE
jgi:hypothetical protein